MRSAVPKAYSLLKTSLNNNFLHPKTSLPIMACIGDYNATTMCTGTYWCEGGVDIYPSDEQNSTTVKIKTGCDILWCTNEVKIVHFILAGMQIVGGKSARSLLPVS